MSNKVLVKMYRAVDSLDDKESMFAVRQDTGEVAPSLYRGSSEPWLNQNDFGAIYGWCWGDPSRFKDAINPVLIWEAEIPVSKEDM